MSKIIKPILFLILLIVFFKSLELLFDYLAGNNDGEFLLVRYFMFLSIGFYLLVISFKTNQTLLSKFTIVFSSLLITITAIELTFFILVNQFLPAQEYKREQVTLSPDKRFTIFDADIGYRATPDAITTESLYYNDTKISEVTYNTDSLGRRVTPSYFNDTTGKKYACFLGCSFTFGLSVNDDQTLPSRFAQQDTNFRSYNYGMNGYGPQHVFSLTKKVLASKLNESEGIFIYIFMDEHIRRAIGDQFFIESNVWSDVSPFYVLEADTLSLKGTFGKNRKWINLCYQICNKSYTLRYFKIKFPLNITDAHFGLTGEMIEATYLECKKRLQNNVFYLVIFPGQSSKIVSFIHQPGIKILDFSKLYDVNDSSYRNPGDYHPSAKAYEIVAVNLARKLNEAGNTFDLK